MIDRCGISAATEVLDVGGLAGWWMAHPPVAKSIVLLNLRPLPELPPGSEQYHFHLVLGDGCRLEFADQSFDVAVSNSVIEHLGDWQKQKAFAGELTRVSKALWVQTPAKCFFIEPHYLAPFVHWLPTRWQRKLLPWVSLRFRLEDSPLQSINELVDELRLLNYREVKELFPDCVILRERFLGILTKSYVAYRPLQSEQ
ncbi:MAG: class I SAM-dependent methyltransferase [Verrucomicrobiales bacterium]